MIESYLIEGVLSSLFDYLKKKVIISPKDRSKFDFIIKDDNEKKIGIEVKGTHITSRILNDIQLKLAEHPDIDEFYLITPNEPPQSWNNLKPAFKKIKVNFTWLSINQFIQKQNLGIELSKDLRKALLDLQVAAVTSKFEGYNKKYIGSSITPEDLKARLKLNLDNIENTKTKAPSIIPGLERQFSYNAMSNLSENLEKLEESLGFGKEYSNAIIILTDIKNFSSLVSVSEPDDLQDLMNKYYRNARELVFKYNGVLDKFIGDAVLAIFNYPFRNKDSYTNATMFCSELIVMGENLLHDFQMVLDQEIETGTRVGIATGPIYPLNIGQTGYEVTFIGDKINLTARLEKNCDVNGILLSNKFYHKLRDNDPDFAQQIDFINKIVDPSDAKGQVAPIRAWLINKEDIEKIIKQNYKTP